MLITKPERKWVMRFKVLYNFNLLVLLQLAYCDCRKRGLASTDSPWINAEVLPQQLPHARTTTTKACLLQRCREKTTKQKQETINLHAMLLLPFSPFWPFCPGFPWGEGGKERKQTNKQTKIL